MCARRRSSGCDGSETSGSPTPRPPQPRLATGEDGAVSEDIYCLTCGYNLRGLHGDPVRCPECGDLNDLGTVVIPAKMIRDALRKMETAPTYCVVCAILLSTFGTLALFTRGLSILVVPLAVLGWLVNYRRTKKSFNNQSGWRRILLDFHVVALPCMMILPILVFALYNAGNYRSGLGKVVLAGWLVAVPAVLVALRVYYAARARITIMQRDAAVRIARQTLRKTLHRQRRR